MQVGLGIAQILEGRSRKPLLRRCYVDLACCNCAQQRMHLTSLHGTSVVRTALPLSHVLGRVGRGHRTPPLSQPSPDSRQALLATRNNPPSTITQMEEPDATKPP
jgi:hypothetical protein